MSIMCAFAYKTASNKKSIKQEKHKKNKKNETRSEAHQPESPLHSQGRVQNNSYHNFLS